MYKKIFKHSLIYALAPQMPKLVSIMILPILTKYLTASDYGVSATIMAYTGLLGGIADLGLTLPIINAYYHHPTRWKIVWRILHGYLLIWNFIFAIILFLVVYYAVPHEYKKNAILIATLYALPSIFGGTLNVFASRYYQIIKRDPTYLGIVTAVTGSLGILFNYVTIVHFRMGFMGWFWSNFLVSIISNLFWAYPVLFKLKIFPIFHIKKSYIFKQLSVALPLIPHNYSSYLLNTSDRLVMSYYKMPLSNMGKYNFSYLFGNYFEFFGSALGMAVGPATTELIAAKNDKSDLKLRNLFFILQSLFILIGFYCALWIKEIFQILVKNYDLKQSYPMAIIILMSYTYRPMYWSVVNKLGFYEKTSQFWKISTLAGIINLLLNLIFIPIYGIWVAVITTFLSMLYLGFSGFALESFKSINKLKYYPMGWMCSIIIMTVFVYLLRDISVVQKSILTVGGLLIATTVLWKFKYLMLKK